MYERLDFIVAVAAAVAGVSIIAIVAVVWLAASGGGKRDADAASLRERVDHVRRDRTWHTDEGGSP